ncbi:MULTISPECIES: holo-ACP synthase [unclassified Granulicatella]|uniref:holo-ACP synthase n=1 Tax=unclassified Granulicatella TaxID=2630493 RepID=UPI0010742E45|nr:MULTISPECIES: holo-ACP synthase [unclassified Granulicatella]MBF0780683.1 holo-ACP synthase [Granulicatella sp. 19428wC4_WM01]TFU94225.1 holo-ACP synthase [Granulicatella sp. WM01]
MIVGIGLDVIELDRIAQARKKSEKFAQRILTEREYQVYHELGEHRQIEFLAGRFAAKEAFSKAFGTGIGAVSFHDIEVLPGTKNRPIMTCSKFSGHIFVSITHTQTVAAAQVILEEQYERGDK